MKAVKKKTLKRAILENKWKALFWKVAVIVVIFSIWHFRHAIAEAIVSFVILMERAIDFLKEEDVL